VAETLFDVFLDCYCNALHAVLQYLPTLGEDYQHEVQRYEQAKTIASGVQRELRIASARIDLSEEVRENSACKALERLKERYSTRFLFGFYPEMLILASV
jgi:hypothetical protein